MVHYKLSYFPVRASAEVIRQIFAAAEQEFEDVRITHEDWPNHKAQMPFGQMPVLEVDGQQLPQSMAIARYLARKFGLAGKSDWDQAIVDSLADQYKDTILEIVPYLMVLVGKADGDLEAMKRDILLPATNKTFTIFTRFLKGNSSGFLVGEGLTYADLLVADGVADLASYDPEILEGFPELVAHINKIHSIPAIKKWRETRPKSDY